MLQEKSNPAKKALKTRVKKRLAKKKSQISNRVKKIFNNNEELLGVVMFDHSKSDEFYEVPVSMTNGNAISINIVQHPLDQYSSPYLMNLSTQKYIERVKPVLDSKSAISYQDLPGGELLDKIQVFDLLSFENSEILNSMKLFWRTLVKIARRPFYQVDTSLKLPMAKNSQRLPKLDIWQEVAVINLVVFLVNKISQFFANTWFYGRTAYGNSIGQFFRRDEEVNFESREIVSDKLFFESVSKLESKVVIKSHKSEGDQFGWSRMSGDFSRFFQSFSIDHLSLKPLLAFFALALVITIPIRSYFYIQSAQSAKGQVLGQAEEALSSLEAAQNALVDLNLVDAERYMTDANNDFISAQEQLNEIKSFLTVLAAAIPVNNSFKSGTNLLDLGEKLTKAGEYLISGLNDFSSDSDFSLSSRIKNFKSNNSEALAQLISAQDNLNKININHLPVENREKFIKLKDNLPKFIESLKKSDEIMQFAINFLGEQELKKYLIIFQNDNELRASGGFMGSLALADFKNGNLENIGMPAGGTYDLRAGLTKLLQSPEPLHVVNPKWEFQDTNWWSDFPTSANNIAYFYNKSDGATIDGVIAINSDWLGKLLDVVGPIEMPDYQKTISSANFELELQKSVEIEYTDKKQPKKILTELAPKLISNIFEISPDKILDLITALDEGLKEKDIQINMFGESEQKFIAKNNWDGRIKDTEKDYLSVVNTNLGGGKTDGVINQEIYHKATILADGSIIDSVVISRSHFGPTDELFTNVANRSFIRVYVPLGSELIRTEGFKRPADSEFRTPDEYLEEDSRLANERLAVTDSNSLTKTYNENNKTVFANWVTVQPGQTKEVLLVYKLPFKIDLNPKEKNQNSILKKIMATFASTHVSDSYSLLVQKQSGSNEDKFVGQVTYPDGLSTNVSYPDNVENSSNQSIYEDNLSHDLFYFIGLTN